VEGDLTLGANSSVYIEIDGTTIGTEYDRLDVSGNFGLAGTLNVSIGSGFTPDLGNSFNALGFETVSGSFTTINGLNIGGGLVLDTIWESTYLALDVVSAGAPPGETITWTGAGDGTNWVDGSNWDLGRAPAALDTVVVTLDGGYTVSMAADATVARLVLSDAANNGTQVLTVTQGATLRVDSAATVAERTKVPICRLLGLRSSMAGRWWDRVQRSSLQVRRSQSAPVAEPHSSTGVRSRTTAR
jgi:hypothetical protein